MAENLKKAQEASGEEKQTALHNCFLTFDALSNNTSMREILRTCKVDQFEHLTEVVNICISLALNRELSILDPSMADLDDKVKLQESASKFLKIYTQ